MRRRTGGRFLLRQAGVLAAAAAGAWALALASVVVGGALAGGRSAVGAQAVPRTLLLPRDADVRVRGPELSAAAAGFPRGVVLAAVGDVNGDGRPDLAVATEQGHHGDETRSFVLFGGRLPARLALPAGRARGFGVRDALLEPAGDVDGDGLADLIRCNRLYAQRSGVPLEATVLFGRPGAQAPGDRGLHVRGASCGRGVGDLDGDGLADLLFTIEKTLVPTAAAIVYGSRRPAAVDLARLDGRGFRIVASRSVRLNVAPVGDVNRDGRADLVADRAPGKYSSGTWLRLVFGSRRTATLDLDAAATRKLPVIACGGRELRSSGPAGDVDGDEIGDLVVGSLDESYIILGRRGRWPHQRSCRSRGSIAIEHVGDNVNGPVLPAGDIDGDGLGDLLVGVPLERYPSAGPVGGTVYLVRSRRGRTTIDPAHDAAAVRIRLSGAEGSQLDAYTAPGDLTGDGTPDIAVGDATLGLTWIVSGKLQQ